MCLSVYEKVFLVLFSVLVGACECMYIWRGDFTIALVAVHGILWNGGAMNKKWICFASMLVCLLAYTIGPGTQVKV